MDQYSYIHTGDFNLTTMAALTMERSNHVDILLSRWQLMLLLFLLGSCSAQSIYYVTPTPDTPCPGEPCHTLSEYVAGQYFNNLLVNSTMEFLPGNHTLEQTISVTNLTWLTLRGDSSSLPEVTSRIECTRPAWFIFTGITELHISALAIISCSHNGMAAVSIISVPQSNISNCIFHSNVNTNYSYDNSGYNHGCGREQGYDSDGGDGGVLHIQHSYVILTGNKFENNSAGILGGALAVCYSTLSLTRNTFQYNSAYYAGGALYIVDSTLNLTGNTFQYNSADHNIGGALRIVDSTLKLTGNTFQYNSAENGGALDVSDSILSLTGNTFQNNSAVNSGGAQDVFSSTLHFIGNNFHKNYAAFGGALHIFSSSVTFTDDCFTDSYAQFRGGAILATSNSLVKMYNITIGNNRAQYGGGMAAEDSQLKVLKNTYFENNTASYGGGLYVHSTEFNGNAIFAKNSVTEGGGGIYASGSTFFLLDNTTIIENSAMDGGGLLLSGGSKLIFQLGIAIQVHLISNSAKSTGGAIKVESNTRTYCIPYVTDDYIIIPCTLHRQTPLLDWTDASASFCSVSHLCSQCSWRPQCQPTGYCNCCNINTSYHTWL